MLATITNSIQHFYENALLAVKYSQWESGFIFAIIIGYLITLFTQNVLMNLYILALSAVSVYTMYMRIKANLNTLQINQNNIQTPKFTSAEV